MHRVFLILLCGLLGYMPTLSAAVPTVTPNEVEVLVVDSSYALLPNVEVKIGGKTFTTSWDGRVLLNAQQLGKAAFSCKEFYDAKRNFTKKDLGTTQFVVLRHKPVALKPTNYHRVGGIHREVMYEKAAPMALSKISCMDGGMAEIAVEDAMPLVAESSGPAAKAGLLTAGEVNDFAKWHLWQATFNRTFSSYEKDWRLKPLSRFTAQVTNQDGFPMVNIDVQLLDEQGNTIYQARTDNTGKAELWGEAGATLLVDDQRKQAIRDAKVDFALQSACSAPSSADVFFIFDATGSMGDELRYLQAEMQDVIARSQSAVGGLQIRTGALVYRDHSDDYVTRISRLTDRIADTQRFISAQQANGGGDFPEAVPEAMMAAINSAGWDLQARARIAFLVLDAPCHTDSVTIALLHQEILDAAAMGIRIIPVVCSGLDKSGELLMRSIALMTNGTGFFLTDDSGIGNPHLKPATDSLKVEHLNDMLVRTIISFCQMPSCSIEQWADSALLPQPTDDFLPNPFTTDDLDTLPALLPQLPVDDVLQVRPNPCDDYCEVILPLGADALYLSDLSGKTVFSLVPFSRSQTAPLSQSQTASPRSLTAIPVSSLATGIYFVKAFYGGRWYTKKLIVR